MIDQITEAIAVADSGKTYADGARYRRLGLAALKPLAKPAEAMIAVAMKEGTTHGET
jgi:hypothetical protein